MWLASFQIGSFGSFFFPSQHNRLLIQVASIGCLLTSHMKEARPCSTVFSSTRVCWLATRTAQCPRNVGVTSFTAPNNKWRKTLQTIATYTLAIANTLRLAERLGELITRQEIEAAAKRWASRNSTRRSVPTVGAWRPFTYFAMRWLSFLGRLQPAITAPQPYAEQVTRFADYMRHERGLSPQTIEVSCSAVREFLARLSEAGLRLDTLTIAQIDDILTRHVRDRCYGRVTIRGKVSRLRTFFRYAEACAWCRPGLAVAIVAPRVFRDETIPVGPSWDDVKRLLVAAQGNQAADIRARAMLMLLAVYALRAGEVVGLRLENFDWQREILTVQHGKRQAPRLYPLSRSTGDAVLRYLREVRPKSTRREVFLTLQAPFGPMSSSLLGHLVRQRLRALGVTLPHYGPHALRHSCATHLLAQGLSLKEIGDHLGHQSPETTQLYAKVDLIGLRAVGDFDLEGLA
jgi:site-specific recombinase XerD